MILAVVRERSLPTIDRARVWLDGRSARERALLGVLAFWACIALIWYALLGPLLSANAVARDRIALYEQLQARLRIAPAGAASTPSGPTMASDGALDEGVRQVASALGLSPEVTSDGDDVRITVANARFDSALPFVQAIERSGAAVEALRMDATDQPGVINLSMTVSRP